MRKFAITLIVTAYTYSLGCAEHVMIRSAPSGANVYINGQSIGHTPVDFGPFSHSVQSEYKVRAELDGYRPFDGMLESRFSVGRIFAVWGTSGIYFAFRGFREFPEENYDINLRPVSVPDNATAAQERLQQLETLHKGGLVTEDEYRALRGQLIRDMLGR